jgi:signal transduction histidine kinase
LSGRDPLAERLAAEQDERRRLAELIHDGPVQQLAAIAQMLDAAAHALGVDNTASARHILRRATEVAREANADLRELVAGIEPSTLHEQGFSEAVRELADRLRARRRVRLELDVDAGDGLGVGAQAGLYQIVREAIDQAVRRGAPSRIEIAVASTQGGGAALTISDDGPPERRSTVLETLAERAATLNGRFTSEARWPRGSMIRIELPPSAARR